MGHSLRQILDEKLQRYEAMEKMLLDPAVLADSQRLAAVARQRGQLAKLATRYRQFKQLNEQIRQAREWLEGPDLELHELAEAELSSLKAQRDQLWDELLELTIGDEDAQRDKCILEIRAGTGGEEAALFARDLFNMYKHYCEDRGWKVEVLHMNPTDLGGFKEVILGVEGEGAYRVLQYENGGHRVQRVPQTEAKGRIHTSAATVAVLAEPEEIEIDLKPEDYREDVFSSSGPGGQHVNKTASAIRLTHFATGIVVQCQDERSQHKNRAKALRMLKTRLYNLMHEEERKKRAAERKSKIGSGDRNERIRTYNFPQNRVTDHRIGLDLYQLDTVLAGNLQPIIDALQEHERQELRSYFGTMEER